MTVGAVLWAIVGFAIAMSALPGVNQDARVLVTTFSILGPLCAVGAAWLIHTGQLRRAGLLRSSRWQRQRTSRSRSTFQHWFSGPPSSSVDLDCVAENEYTKQKQENQ
jgi:hypothetical protein